MSKIVVYNSSTGFTKQYADWIAESLGCEAVSIKNVKLNELKKYDQVIYGGYIMAGLVSGFNKIKALSLSNVVVFGCGISADSENERNKMAEANQIPSERFFYFEGGFNPEKLNFFKRILLKMIKKSLESKENKTEDDLRMLETFNGVNRLDKESIKEIVDFCNL